jgi:hypothetical protein
MKKSSRINKLLSFIGKYGIITGPISVIKWFLTKYKFNQYATKVSNIEGEVFKIINFNIFNELYLGESNQETNKILRGERKVLFYNKDDINMQFDIKTRWEINRMHHLPIIALSSRSSNKYTKDLIEEFQYKNLEKIFNESNAMEVAISAINVITAYQLIDKESNKIKETDVELFLSDCLTYIMSNIEVGIKYSNNHYFFNLLGVLWITENIVGSKETNQLKRIAYSKFEGLLKQILNQDGSLYEGSTHYHKYLTDSLLSFIVLNKPAQKKNNILKHAILMYRFCCYASFNDELIGIGDNDSGRLLALPEYFQYNSSSLLLTHELAKRLDVTYSESDEENVLNTNLSKNTSFGLFKLQNKNWKIAIRCDQIINKPANKKIGSHYHNDQLSVLVQYKGSTLFVDKGTYSYVQKYETRLENLKTASHNTVNIDQQEQNTIYNDWNYYERRAVGKIISFNNKSFIGEHNGYLPYIHRRKVDVSKGLVIKDSIEYPHNLSNSNSVKIQVCYHLHPSVCVKILNSHEALLELNGITMLFKANTKIRIEKSSYSKEYGKCETNYKITLSADVTKYAEIETVINEEDEYCENKRRETER